jgi:translation initiation factor IF-3
MFKGREITHPQQAHVLVNKIMELIKDKANVEQPAKFEGRNMTLVVGPK